MRVQWLCRVTAAAAIIVGFANTARADDREFKESVARILEKMTKRHELSEAEIRTLKQQMAGVQKDVGDLKDRLSSLERRNAPGSAAPMPAIERSLPGNRLTPTPALHPPDQRFRGHFDLGCSGIRSGGISIGPNGISIGGHIVIQGGWDDDD